MHPLLRFAKPIGNVESDVTVPDYHEPFVGWRAWNVCRDPAHGALELRSLIRPRHYWPAGRELVARCDPGVVFPRHSGEHEAPDRECRCGIYAVSDTHGVEGWANSHRCTGRQYDAVWRVVGTAKLWGRVVVGDAGWRAQRAYPARVFIARKEVPHPGVEDYAAITRELPEQTTADEVAAAMDEYGVETVVFNGTWETMLRQLRWGQLR